jgi:hypothetical protein
MQTPIRSQNCLKRISLGWLAVFLLAGLAPASSLAVREQYLTSGLEEEKYQ